MFNFQIAAVSSWGLLAIGVVVAFVVFLIGFKLGYQRAKKN